MRILLVEDNLSLSSWLERLLRKSHYAIDCVHDGESADEAIRATDYALVILDLALPDFGGLEVLRRLRKRGQAMPVLILTADDTLASRVSGLDCGADDYLAKPFDAAELEARIRAQLRRTGASRSPELELGPLTLDTNSRLFRLNGRPLELTPREHAVLETLLRCAGATVSKTKLLESVFGFDEDANPAAIEIYVHRVRRKLEPSRVSIVTLRGLGYLLRLGDAD
jgi:two-component system, OmpR family, response regulator TctD